MMQRYFLGGALPLGDRECGVIASTPELGRDGLAIEPSGIDFRRFRDNPIVLWQHRPEDPIGIATAVGIEGGNLLARVEFAPEGISACADQACSLVKAGVVKGVSIGFDPKEVVPPRNGSAGGTRVTRCELLEISFVAVPADVGASVVARSAAASPTAAMFRRLWPMPEAGLERAASIVKRYRSGPMIPHAHHVYYLLEQRQREDADYSRAARQRELERLRVGA